MNRIERMKQLLSRRSCLHGLTLLPSIVEPESIAAAQKEMAEINDELERLSDAQLVENLEAAGNLDSSNLPFVNVTRLEFPHNGY